MSELFKSISTDAQLYESAELNNTYDARAVHKTLQTALQTSYSFLNEYQKQNIKFQQFHYDTKEKDMKYTRKTMMNEYNRLQDLIDNATEEFEKIQYKEEQDKLIVVDDGDFYLDDHHRPCFSIPFDIVGDENRPAFRESNFANSEFTLDDIANNKNIFGYIPIIVIDELSYFNCKFYVDHEKLYVILPYDENFVYTDDRNQYKHHTDVIFINNAYMVKVPLKIADLLKDEIVLPEDKQLFNRTNGIFFGFLRDMNNLYSGSFNVMERTEKGYKFKYGITIKGSEDATDTELTIVFFDRLCEYKTQTGKNIIEPSDYSAYPLMLFEQSEGIPYDMPIPEDNVLLLENNNGYLSTTTTVVRRSYPNIYQISGYASGNYQVFYFYKWTNHLKYTPIHNFYYQYLSNIKDKKLTMEEYLNKIYFDSEYDEFHLRTRYILNFQDTPVEFSDYDFMEHPESFETKEVYQSEKLKAYIKKDYCILEEYAENTRTHSDIFHMFVENVNLSKRERKSSFKDDWAGGKSFFRSYDICDEYEEGSYLVVSDDFKEDYDPYSMIRLMDFGSFTEKPNIGDFVKLNGLIQMFVFMMKPIPEERLHSLRIYIDGLRIFNYETTIFLDSQYIYLPVEAIRPNSYIMIEDHHEGSFISKVTFTRDNTTKSFTIMNMNKPLYSSDIYLLDPDGYEIDSNSYKISFNNTYFDDPREIEDPKNSHIILSDFNIELLDPIYYDKEIEIRAIKKFETYEIQMKRRGFPRLSLHSVQNCRNKNHIEIFVDGKLLPENLYRVDKLVSNGILRIQLLLLVEAGSSVIIDISPYTHSVCGVLNQVSTSKVINLDHIINKPVSIDYYDFYLNGRRLGLPNIFKIEDHGLILKNIDSDYRLEIRERERDDEYYGYTCYEHSPEGHDYYYNVLDFLSENFASEKEKYKIIDDIVLSQKDARVYFEENTNREDRITVDNLPSLEEQYRIFYHEDLLPLGLVNPDLVQFDKVYLNGLFRDIYKDRLQNDVIFLDPDMRANAEHQLVLLTGESDLDAENDVLPIEITINNIYKNEDGVITKLPDILFMIFEKLQIEEKEKSELIKSYASSDKFPEVGEEKYVYYDKHDDFYYYFNTDTNSYSEITHFGKFDTDNLIIVSPEIK